MAQLKKNIQTQELITFTQQLIEETLHQAQLTALTQKGELYTKV